MEDNENHDTYVTQLKEVFDSCDSTGSGCLNEAELRVLCEKLHLTDHTSFLIQHLVGKKGNSEVKFEDFKECFVAVLSQTVPCEEEEEEEKSNSVNDDENSSNEDNAEREVSPKFTFGRKKYGRRSRPASVVDDDFSMPAANKQNASEQLTPNLSAVFKSPVKSDAVIGKRPISPGYTQQPPMKSGRMTSVNSSSMSCLSGTHLDSSTDNLSSSSDSETNLSFEHNPVEYLQQTWKKLNIGKDGFLNVDELALVCEHIGMDMTEEVVAQLFEKLDCDQDGKISFEEFLQGLFQHGDPQCFGSPVLKSDCHNKTIFKDASRDDHELSTSWASGIFSCIDPENSGYAESSAILELWESLEMPCSPQLLKDLGFRPEQKINLSDLSSVLEEELIRSVTTSVGQLAFITYQNELNYLRQINEQIRTERSKLKANIEEANARAALLAQEVDDNHARLENTLKDKLLLMEKKYQEQARELVDGLQQEREAINVQANNLKQQLQNEIQTVREEEVQLRNRLNVLEEENARFELELQDITEKYLETKKQNEAFQKDLSMIPSLKQQLADLESHQGEIQERHHQSLLLEIDNYKKVNQELQDKIDELTLEIENLQQQNTVTDDSYKSINRSHSWLSDYKKSNLVGFKRRGSESSTDENSDDECPTMEKLRRTFPTVDDKNFGPDSFEEKNTLNGTESNKARTFPKTKGAQPSSVDILLKDMFIDRTQLIKKLHISEEMRMNAERSNSLLRYKNKLLSKLVLDVSKTVLV